eukprot:gene21307-biopygen21972
MPPTVALHAPRIAQGTAAIAWNAETSDCFLHSPSSSVIKGVQSQSSARTLNGHDDVHFTRNISGQPALCDPKKSPTCPAPQHGPSHPDSELVVAGMQAARAKSSRVAGAPPDTGLKQALGTTPCIPPEKAQHSEGCSYWYNDPTAMADEHNGRQFSWLDGMQQPGR